MCRCSWGIKDRGGFQIFTLKLGWPKIKISQEEEQGDWGCCAEKCDKAQRRNRRDQLAGFCDNARKDDEAQTRVEAEDISEVVKLGHICKTAVRLMDTLDVELEGTAGREQ